MAYFNTFRITKNSWHL